MKIHRNWNEWEVEYPVATTGIFDGVHLGHASILERLKQAAWERGGESVMITFWPHPRTVLSQGNSRVRLLSTLEEKGMLLENYGLDHLVIIPFDEAFSQLPACDFVERYLVEKMRIRHLVIGYNHQFGKNREGDFETIRTCADNLGFTVEQLPATVIDHERVSSSLIREAIEVGDMERANHFLGYEYFLQGLVVGGSRIGRRIGFPTANIQPVDPCKLIPRNGVYAVRVRLGDSRFRGMLNIGNKPTLNESSGDPSIEVHILDFHDDIYHKQISIHFIRRIRDEMKFGGVQELKEQLEKDRRAIAGILGPDDPPP